MTSLLPALVVGYLVGAVSTATVVARRRGVDLRAVGSGNPGASNVGRALGARAGIAVGAADLLKGLVPAVAFGTVSSEAGLVAGVAAVVGHVTSPFLRGRGGKGVATAAGAILGAHPLWGLVVVVVWLVVVAATRWIAAASMAAAAAVVVVAVVVGEDRLWAAAIASVVLVRHWRNVVERVRG